MRRWLSLCLVLTAVGCKVDEPVLVLEISRDPVAKSQSVRITVTDATQRSVTSDPFVFETTGKARVVILQAKLQSPVTVTGAGFSDATGTTATVPVETTGTLNADFTTDVTRVVRLILTPKSSCADATPGQPLVPESACDDGKDNDCDGAKDCADSDCAGKTCGANSTCKNQKCLGPETGFAMCNDGEDNDMNGFTDCEDQGCVGMSCTSNANRCLVNPTCSSGTCSGGSLKTCTEPTLCHTTAGTCDVATGNCVYPPDPGGPCDDGNPCSITSQCSAAGTCEPLTFKSCAVPDGGCFTGATCNPTSGTCVNTKKPVGSVCPPKSPCLTATCQADGTCLDDPATAPVCNPPLCQTGGGTCAADGGCSYLPVAAGIHCGDGGVCNGAGLCQSGFGYEPSNFSMSGMPDFPSSNTTLACARSVIDISNTSVNLSGLCTGGSSKPNWSHDGGVALLTFQSFTVGANQSVLINSVVPVIFVLNDSFVIQDKGLLVVDAGSTNCAVGAGTNGRASGGLGSVNGGAAGGGFGTAGAAGAGPVSADGGAVNGTPELIPLRGGCPGGLGAGNTAPRALGGGALQISARDEVDIGGKISAPGRGGPETPGGTGGNGAGSGGAILFEGRLFILGPPGIVAVNGGGGAQGGGNNTPGAPGEDGHESKAAARGGTGGNGYSSKGGFGGDGAAGTNVALPGKPGTGGPPPGNGGAGGGGLGRIRINMTDGCNINGMGVLSGAVTSNKPGAAGCPP